MRIFLTASALAGTRAINRHYRIRWIQRETDLRVQGLRIFLIASALAGARVKNKHNVKVPRAPKLPQEGRPTQTDQSGKSSCIFP